MPRDLTQQEHKARLEGQLRRDGGKIAPVPDGPRLEHFSALELAQGVEQEVARVGNAPGHKIVLHMDVENALRLASYLRRAVLLGA
jgi:hypothetical protein